MTIEKNLSIDWNESTNILNGTISNSMLKEWEKKTEELIKQVQNENPKSFLENQMILDFHLRESTNFFVLDKVSTDLEYPINKLISTFKTHKEFIALAEKFDNVSYFLNQKDVNFFEFSIRSQVGKIEEQNINLIECIDVINYQLQTLNKKLYTGIKLHKVLCDKAFNSNQNKDEMERATSLVLHRIVRILASKRLQLEAKLLCKKNIEQNENILNLCPFN